MSTVELSAAVKKQIDHWVAKYPADQKQSAVMAALQIVQDESADHCLTPGLIEAVALYLEMPVIAVQEVATFYSMYEHKPVGKYKVCVCTNISCKLKGSDAIMDHLHHKLGIGLNETTADKKFTLKEVECLGACIGAPMCQINKDYHENLTPEKLDTLLDELE